jgi:hypothetical protein
MNIYEKLGYENIKCDRTAIVDAQVQGVDSRDTIAVQPALRPSQAPALQCLNRYPSHQSMSLASRNTFCRICFRP